MPLNNEPPSGTYPIDSVHRAELERLEQQHIAWSPQTAMMLDQIGVSTGWNCLDLGCGPKGLTRDLSARVGPTGQVSGLEYNPQFAQIARIGAPPNVIITQGDAYATDFANACFDFVHMRFLASTSGEPERLVEEAIRLVKPGGYFAMQEADAATLACYPPHPAWTRLATGLKSLFPDASGDNPAAHRHYGILLDHGLEEVSYHPAVIGTRAGDQWQDFLPATVHSARNALIGAGLMSEDELDQDIAACRAHLSDPKTVFIGPMLVQTWGRKPH